MNVYTESAFVVAIVVIMIALGDVARRLTKIQGELRDWHKEWKASQSPNDMARDEKEKK